jgi:hypothetical protein
MTDWWIKDMGRAEQMGNSENIIPVMLEQKWGRHFWLLLQLLLKVIKTWKTGMSYHVPAWPGEDMMMAETVDNWKTMGKPSQSNFFRCQCLCVFIMCRMVGRSWKKVIFRYFWSLNKGLYWNTINFNDIRCNFKALLNIFLHLGITLGTSDITTIILFLPLAQWW